MKETRRWVTRRMRCPGGRGESNVLLEWQVDKGKKVLKSITCFHPSQSHYSGEGCQWECLERISPVEYQKSPYDQAG